MYAPLDFSSADYAPPLSMGPGAVCFFDIALLFVAFGATIVCMFLRARELAVIQAREDADLHDRAARPLRRGPSRAVRGRVDPSDDPDVPVEVDIEQRVTNHTSKNSRWHTWSEISRSVRATPFYLVRDDGDAVYVLVDPQVLVVDLLGTRYPNETPGRRVRFAEVKRGDEVIVYGDLDEGFHPRARSTYRGGVGWTLQAPKKGRMLLASEGLRRRHSGRISFLARWGALLAVAFLLTHAFTTLPFITATFFGSHVTARAKPYTYVTHGKSNSTTTHYALEAVADDGFTLKQDITSGLYRDAVHAVPAGQAMTVPMIRTGDLAWASYVGDTAYLPGIVVILEMLAAGITLLVLRSKYGATYAWYDRDVVTEPGGSGHWRETRPIAPIDPSTN